MTAKSISVFSPKGGVGKTTLTLCVAGALAARGRSVLVVDLDPQGGALAFASLAQRAGHDLPFVVSPNRCAGRWDVVVYDHPPSMPADGLHGEVVLMPTLLDAASHLLYRRGKAFAQEQGKPVLAIPFRVRLDRSEQRALLVKAFPDEVFVRDRAVFATAYGKGLTVYDPRLGSSHAGAARREIDAVLAAVDALTAPVGQARAA